MTASMHSPMEGLNHWEAESTHGPEFSEKYGWKDVEDLRDNERLFFEEMWRVAFAHGRAQGQVDGLSYKSERINELTRENTDFKDQISDLQAQLDTKHNDAALLEGEKYKLQEELRDAAVGLRRQRETIGELEKKVVTLVDRNMKRLSYRAWHKVMTVADERMSKAHP